MNDSPSIQRIEERCRSILASPYIFKELPDELRNLRHLLKAVEQLTREDVPYLVSEIRRLRTLNKQLEATLHPPADPESSSVLSTEHKSPTWALPDTER
jgi:hypothetical protein